MNPISFVLGLVAIAGFWGYFKYCRSSTGAMTRQVWPD